MEPGTAQTHLSSVATSLRIFTLKPGSFPVILYHDEFQSLRSDEP